MARPERNNVDYFPFLCKEGKAMYYIDQKYKNDGYASWIKILRQLAISDYHYIDLSNRVELMFLSSKCNVTEDVLSNIIFDLCELGEFNKMLWTENKIIFSEKFIDNIQDAYLKRNNKCVSLPSLLHLLTSLGVRKPGKLSVNAHTILYNTIEYNSIENSNEFMQAWDSFKKMRKSMKKPITDRAEKGLIKKLEELSAGDEELKVKIIDQSIEHSWLTFYELKSDFYKFSNKNEKVSDVKPLENNVW